MCEGVSSLDSKSSRCHCNHVVDKTPRAAVCRMDTAAGTTTAEWESPASSAIATHCNGSAPNKAEKRPATLSVTRNKSPEDKAPLSNMDGVPCFPACMEDDNQRSVTIASPVATTPTSSSQATTSSSTTNSNTGTGRRSRRNSSRRQSFDNQHENAASGPSFDLEDVAQGVLSPTDYRSVAAPPGSIVVDYDEGTPERSRATLLRDESTDSPPASSSATVLPSDCAPGACNPLDLLAFEELSIDDGGANDRILRPRLGSASQPKTPRRGKSIILPSAPVVVVEPVAKKPSIVSHNTHTDDAGVEPPGPERCSTLHKLCLCEVQLHKSTDSCWLVANGSVYDVTGLLSSHPAGPRSILRKAGGTDCTKDMKFHSKSARNMLEKCFIGKLVACGPDPVDQGDGPTACTIM